MVGWGHNESGPEYPTQFVHTSKEEGCYHHITGLDLLLLVGQDWTIAPSFLTSFPACTPKGNEAVTHLHHS